MQDAGALRVAGGLKPRPHALKPYTPAAAADLGVVHECVQDAGALRVAGGAVDEGLPQPRRVLPQREDVVREHDDLIPPHLQPAVLVVQG